MSPHFSNRLGAVGAGQPRRRAVAHIAVLAAIAAVSSFAAPAVTAQDAARFPDRAVRLVVPAPPGGTNDIVARNLAQQLTQRVGQSFIVENRPGGNGTTAAEHVARAVPDGHTLFLSWAGPLALYQNFTEQPAYDARKDFAPIALLAEVPTVLIAHPSLPVGNLSQFVDHVHAHPGRVAMAISTAGSLPHLLTEHLRVEADLKVLFVPYQGSGPAIKDLLGNQTQAHFENLPAAIGLIRGKRVKALAVASRERIEILPDVPTTAEAGYPGVVATPWFALVAPSGVPAAIQQRLSREVTTVLESSEIREAFAKLGARPLPGSQAAAAEFIERERQKWSKVISSADIQLKQ
jgi:tripartite-type tricarboxylate transporter receptor subunit TctC